MRKLVISALCCILLLFQACVEDEKVPAFVKEETIQLKVTGREQFKFDPLTGQIAFNRERKEFRMHTDNMSDYMVARFDAIPEHEDQEVIATITWTTDTSVETRKNVTLKVVKLEGDKVWLWGKSAKVTLTMRILY